MANLRNNYPSLCIPRIFTNVDETQIRSTFNNLNLGVIHHIDIVMRTNERGEESKRAYIHFTKWFDNEFAKSVRNKLLSGIEVKIVYDNPWYWKVSANMSKLKK